MAFSCIREVKARMTDVGQCLEGQKYQRKPYGRSFVSTKLHVLLECVGTVHASRNEKPPVTIFN